MLQKVFIVIATLVFAFAILFTSIFRTAAVRYEFSPQEAEASIEECDVYVDYQLAYPGKVLPDHILWPLKVVRDRLWLITTTNRLKKAELKLLFADKRIGGARLLFLEGKDEIAYSTLTKAEKYFEEAYLMEEQVRKSGTNTREFSTRLTNAALKHFQIMEEIIDIAPEDAKPGVLDMQNIPITGYHRAKNAMLEQGLEAPQNPYDWR